MNVLILHGILGKAGENWAQWLHDELEARGHSVTMPTLPESDHPDRDIWLSEITKLMKELGDNTVIVAHSLGVTSALDFLESYSGEINGLVSVSGFADDYGMELNSYFMSEKDIDFSAVKQSIKSAVVLYGDNDPYVPQESLKMLADNLDTEPIIIENGGHLNADAGYVEFEQLRDAVIAI